MVSRLDWYVGSVLNELRALGIDKNTLVIFTSDNGPHAEGGANPSFFKSSGPLRGMKRDVYEGGIRVPFIAWMPGTIKDGGRTEQICAFWDIMPTLAELTGQELTEPTDGISILPTILGKDTEEQPQPAYLYWAFNEGVKRQALRIGDWKLIRQVADGVETAELYDLSQDIGETRDLAREKPNQVSLLTIKLDSIAES